MLGAEVIALVQGGCSTGWLAQQKIEKIGWPVPSHYSTNIEKAKALLAEAGYPDGITLKMPFRDAHHVTGRIVAKAAEQGIALHKVPLGDMQAIEPKITESVFDVLSVQASVESRTSYGGTAPANVRAQAQEWLKRLEKEQNSG